MKKHLALVFALLLAAAMLLSTSYQVHESQQTTAHLCILDDNKDSL